MDQPPGSFPLWPSVGIAVCIALSALFSGTETALTALTERAARQLIEQGGRSARLLQAWIDRPSRILSTLLVGNNLVNIAAAVLSVRVAFWLFANHPNRQAVAESVAVASMTLLLLVFAEITPKTFAKQNAHRFAVPAMAFVRMIELPLFPVAWVLTQVSRLIVRLFGGDPSHTQPIVTEEEIEYMIELGAREKVFEEKSRGQLLEAALEFGDTISKEIMIPRTGTFALDATTSVEEALDSSIVRGHSRIPVFDDSIDSVVGVLYAKDLLKAVAKDGDLQQPVRGLLRRVYFVPETQKIAVTLKEMQRRRIHLGVVVDEFGGFSGIITIEDILEELVGEIRDEYDREEEMVRQVDENTFVANALVSIYDLGDFLDVELPDEGDYETLGGFVVSQVGRMPVVGDHVLWDGLDMEVLSADERHVERVRIVRKPASSGETEGLDEGDQ